MKYPIRQFTSLEVALKELEPFIRNGEHLQTGAPFAQLEGMRSREALANWLVCVVVNSEGEQMAFTTDPVGGDGIILNTKTGETWPTEHVLVPALKNTGTVDVEAMILNAIESKQQKGGAAYARGKTLVVFVNCGGGTWKPNRIVKGLPDPLDFAAVWAVGLQFVENDEYVYVVSNLHMEGGDAPAWKVRISKQFDDWNVTRIQ
jgi:hypothetical protein